MVAYAYRAPAGFAGAITRAEPGMTVQPEIIDAANPPTNYGAPVKLVAGKAQPIASGDAASVVMGWAVRAFPVQSSTNALGDSTPPATGLLNVMRRGFMAVRVTIGTAVKGAPVYARVTAASGKAVGDIEATADGANNVAIPGATFEGAADANGICEISYNI